MNGGLEEIYLITGRRTGKSYLSVSILPLLFSIQGESIRKEARLCLSIN